MYGGIVARRLRDLVASDQYNSDTTIDVDPDALGISEKSFVVGATLLVEITANTNTSDVNLHYYGPNIEDNDGNSIVSATSQASLNLGTGTDNNVFVLTGESAAHIHPLSGDEGFRLGLTSTWDGAITLAIHGVILIVHS